MLPGQKKYTVVQGCFMLEQHQAFLPSIETEDAVNGVIVNTG
jgi:hypothetical protein